MTAYYTAALALLLFIGILLWAKRVHKPRFSDRPYLRSLTNRVK